VGLRIAMSCMFLAALVACREGVEQAPACERYTACIRALDDAAGRETDLDRFDPGGGCWGSDVGGTLCERACERGLAFESRRNPVLPMECRP
jgi:hypothetical protein